MQHQFVIKQKSSKILQQKREIAEKIKKNLITFHPFRNVKPKVYSQKTLHAFIFL